VRDLTPLDALGVGPGDRVVEDDGRVVRLEVERDRLGAVLETLPRLGALVDLEVAEAEVEEIIRDLFSRGRMPA
jgi:ABC-2 type transport system ATP-binding protein